MICPSCTEEIDPEVTRMGLGVHPTCSAVDIDPNLVAMELFTTITKAINEQPRSLQTRIGPSEIGHPCARRIAYKLAGTPEINGGGTVAWKPFVGTAIHEQLATIMARAEVNRYSDSDSSPRWHVEERVSVGEVDGIDITGSTDLFDAHHGIVFDWKTTSTNMIKRKFSVHGPGDQYRIQAHLYGRGWQRAGHDVKHVMIIWLVRDGNFSDRYLFTEEYDEQVAIDALERLAMIKSVVDVLGPSAPATFEPVASYCQNCAYFKLGATDLDRACPGDPADVETHRVDISDPFGSR